MELELKYGKKHSTVIQLTNYIEEFSETLHGEHIPPIEAFGPASIKIVLQAGAAFPAIFVNRTILFSMAFFSGIFLSIVFSFFLDFYDQTIKSPRDVTKLLNIPFLGSIPKRKTKDKLVISETNPAHSSYAQSLQAFSGQISVRLSGRDF